MLEYRDENGQYPYAFGGDPDHPGEIKLDEPIALVRILKDLGVAMVNFSASSPYYCPHLIRPHFYPPSDGYEPPEDPLVSLARLVNAAAEIKQAVPEMLCVGSGYSYLQEFIPMWPRRLLGRAKLILLAWAVQVYLIRNYRMTF